MRKKEARTKPPVITLSEKSLKAVAGGLDVTDGTDTEEARTRYANITLKRG